MADIADIQTTFDSGFFRVACQDVARIVSILSLDSTDVRKPANKVSLITNVYEKSVFISRFFYMVFVKGFTPTVFDVLPYHVWMGITIAVYGYRVAVLPFWLRFTGYGRFASWKNLGSNQPAPGELVSRPFKKLDLSKELPLTKTEFGDPQYEKFLSTLYKFTTHLSPHSQSPKNPLASTNFSGNFFDHLTGVYKILIAWNQPQYVVRAGLFHSVYGTFDYRYSLFDLREGRDKLAELIGLGSEELAFTVCTSDRIGLLRDLMVSMYGADNAKRALNNESVLNRDGSPVTSTGEIDGNPYPPLIGELTSEGYPVRNHITQVVHVLPADLFAQFAVVFIADFMEQGALGFGSADSDVCLFQFLRFRFFNDLLQFVKPYLRYMPSVWDKYMGRKAFTEPTRKEVIAFKRLWHNVTAASAKYHHASHSEQKPFVHELTGSDRDLLVEMVRKYPYLAEPKIALSSGIRPGDILEGKYTRSSLAKDSLIVLEDWGLLTLKGGHSHLKEVLKLVNTLSRE